MYIYNLQVHLEDATILENLTAPFQSLPHSNEQNI